VANEQEFPGADLVAGWYRRNLVIYQNIMTALKPDDRALIIYGSGHVYYLNQLLSENREIELVDVRKYLPKPPINGLPGF